MGLAPGGKGFPEGLGIMEEKGQMGAGPDAAFVQPGSGDEGTGPNRLP